MSINYFDYFLTIARGFFEKLLKKTVLDAKRIANNTVSFAKSYFVRERGICFALCRHAPSKTLFIY